MHKSVKSISSTLCIFSKCVGQQSLYTELRSVKIVYIYINIEDDIISVDSRPKLAKENTSKEVQSAVKPLSHRHLYYNNMVLVVQ